MIWKFFFKRVTAWLFPPKGWADRILEYRNERTLWPVTGHPEMDPIAPWPAEWCVWQPGAVEKADDKPKFELLPCTSWVSGSKAEGDDAVRCARCAIPLHMGQAHMSNNLDIPACSWCVGLVRRTR